MGQRSVTHRVRPGHPTHGARAAFARQGRRLALFTIGWNTLEGLIAIGAGAARAASRRSGLTWTASSK
jgi:hypothetical protein